MPATWNNGIGDPDPRPPVSRIEAKRDGRFLQKEEYEQRTEKPGVSSEDKPDVGVPAREAAKAAGTFGVIAPYEQRKR